MMDIWIAMYQPGEDSGKRAELFGAFSDPDLAVAEMQPIADERDIGIWVIQVTLDRNEGAAPKIWPNADVINRYRWVLPTGSNVDAVAENMAVRAAAAVAI